MMSNLMLQYRHVSLQELPWPPPHSIRNQGRHCGTEVKLTPQSAQPQLEQSPLQEEQDAQELLPNQLALQLASRR